jgi:hypothetical protein
MPIPSAPLAVTLFSAALAATAAAQPFVLPAGLDAVEGNGNGSLPWNSPTPRRYVQLHSDPPGGARQISRLAFRQNATSAANFQGTRTIDMELFMGHGRRADVALMTFDLNYITAPTRVMSRRVVNMGPQGPCSPVGPNPFQGMELAFDAPFAYGGVATIVWDARIHSNTGLGTFNTADAHGSPITVGSAATNGTGCIATGQTQPMRHDVVGLDSGGLLLYAGFVSRGPANAPSVWAIGASDPAFPIPGLCTLLHTDLLLFLPFATDPTGNFQPCLQGLIVQSNNLAGAQLFSQAISLDPGRPDLFKVSCSNGASVVLPAAGSGFVPLTFLTNDDGTTTATCASLHKDMFGSGLVTRFE